MDPIKEQTELQLRPNVGAAKDTDNAAAPLEQPVIDEDGYDEEFEDEDDEFDEDWGPNLVLINNPDMLANYISDGEPITNNLVIAALDGDIETLGMLLDAGGNADARYSRAHPANAEVDANWMKSTDYVRFTDKYLDETYLLQHAVVRYSSTEHARIRIPMMMEMILDYEPDLFAQ